MRHFSIEIPGVLESLSVAAPFTDSVLGGIPDMEGRDRLIHDLKLVTSEALTNAITHGEIAGVPVRLEYALDEIGITITVTDHGIGFEPGDVHMPDFENAPESGYGMFIIKTIMDDVRYEKTIDGNILILTKTWERP